jgi:hypothetical protein
MRKPFPRRMPVDAKVIVGKGSASMKRSDRMSSLTSLLVWNEATSIVTLTFDSTTF